MSRFLTVMLCYAWVLCFASGVKVEGGKEAWRSASSDFDTLMRTPIQIHPSCHNILAPTTCTMIH